MSSSDSSNTGKGKMKRDGKREKKKKAIVPPFTQDDNFMNLEVDHFLGIPNNRTFNQVPTKLPWSAFDTLSPVRDAWQQALQNRRVHDVRAGNHSADSTHSADTAVFFNHTLSPSRTTNAIAVYFLRNKTLYDLPPIPQVASGIPWNCQCISLAGKIYVLGGSEDTTHQLGSKEVYVLDLAGQLQWIKCAAMHQERELFGCGTLEGKIYAFGGNSLQTSVHVSEVYDPSINTWSPIRPMRTSRFNNNVGILGEELVVYGGYRYINDKLRTADGYRAYHPVDGRWRVQSKEFLPAGKLFGYCDERLFMAQEKFYAMTLSNIQVYNILNKSWTVRHTHSFAAIQESLHCVDAVLAVEHELLAILLGENNDGMVRTFLVRSRGFENEDTEIAWEILSRFPTFGDFRLFFRLLER